MIIPCILPIVALNFVVYNDQVAVINTLWITLQSSDVSRGMVFYQRGYSVFFFLLFATFDFAVYTCNFFLSLPHHVSVLERDEGYPVKCTPSPEGVPKGEA